MSNQYLAWKPVIDLLQNIHSGGRYDLGPFALELGVSFTFWPVLDLTSVDAANYAGNPAAAESAVAEIESSGGTATFLVQQGLKQWKWTAPTRPGRSATWAGSRRSSPWRNDQLFAAVRS